MLRWHCVGQLKTFDSSSWTRGQNFVSSLYLHTLCIFVTNANASMRLLGFSLVEYATCTPQHMCWLKYSMDNPRHMRTVLFYLIQTTAYRST